MIDLINFFIKKTTSTTAKIAKDRLKIIVKSQISENTKNSYYLLQLKNDLLKVAQKYTYKPQIISIHIINQDENISILKFDILFYNKNT